MFTVNHQAETFTSFEALDEVVDVDLQIFEGQALLRQVDPLGTAGKATHETQVAAVVPHHLNHEAAPGGHGRLFDLVNVAGRSS